MNRLKNIWNKYNLFYLVLAALIYLVIGILYLITPIINSNGHEIKWAIDDKIPVIKPFVIFYYLYYIVPIILFWLVSFYDKKKYYRVVISGYLCAIFSSIVFSIYQVHMVRPEINGDDIFAILIRWMHNEIDPLALNCCPSLHSVIGIYTMISLIGIKKLPVWSKILSIVCGLGIILSTLFIKQHYVLDVICGILTATIIYMVTYIAQHYYYKKKDEKAQI